MATVKLVLNVVGETLNRKEQLWHRAIALVADGFLVNIILICRTYIVVLNNAETVWNPYEVKYITALEPVQKRAAKLV